MSLTRAIGLRVKAGLSGLFIFACVTLSAAQPLTIEITGAEAAFDQRTGAPIVTFKMSAASAKQFAELTAKNVGRKFELRVDGMALFAPVIREPILGGSGQISDDKITAETAKDLARRLSGGNAKVEVEVVD